MDRARAMRRLLMYSQDGNGLGHLRRSFNIARDVLRRDPRCDILIAADSPAVSIVGSTPGIDLIKLPTIVKTGASTWKNGTLIMLTVGAASARKGVVIPVIRALSCR